jgi:hypothetical protein
MAPPTRSRLHDGRIAGDLSDSDLDFARRPRPTWLRPLLLGLVLVALGAGAVVKWQSAPPEGPPNVSVTFATVLPTIELHDVGGPWVGVVDQSWRGYSDPSHRQADCAALAEKVGLAPGFTLTLLDAEGTDVVECGSGIGGGAPPPPMVQ